MNYAILKEESVLPRQEGNAMAAAAGGGLTEWAERSALRRAGRMMAGGPAPAAAAVRVLRAGLDRGTGRIR
jgi:hypothetical protein